MANKTKWTIPYCTVELEVSLAANAGFFWRASISASQRATDTKRGRRYINSHLCNATRSGKLDTPTAARDAAEAAAAELRNAWLKASAEHDAELAAIEADSKLAAALWPDES